MQVRHLTVEQIEAGMGNVLASPQDLGRLETLVIRPGPDQREICESVYLSPEGGVKGDRWALSKGKDGKPDPRSQISVMNARLLRMIAGDEKRMALAGDNLIVDLDLSTDNLPVGQKLAVGEAVLEVTDLPHTGCGKFAERFGQDALRYINAAEHRSLRLRGLYVRVLKAGTVQTGDVIRKMD
ncbi:MAG: MOSC domain-containing protein [Anaerolineae bacterium]